MINKITRSLKRKLTRFLLDLSFYFAEDASISCAFLHELYENVPDNIKKETIIYYRFYLYDDCDKQEEIDTWLKEESE